MIKLTSLNKYYKKSGNHIHVIDNTSISFPDKGLVSICGKSGSGKTTLLNVIGGLDAAKGTIEIDNKVFHKYKANQVDYFRNKYFGYIFQNYLLMTDMTVYENMEQQMHFIGIYDKKEINKRIDYCLGIVGMLDYKRRDAGMLSGGQQQRICIARALAKNASCIICDEPTGNLDTKNTVEILNILKSISKTKLVLLVTHDLEMAKTYSDQIIEIVDGKISNNYVIFNDDQINDTHNFYLQEYQKKEIIYGNVKLNYYANDLGFPKNIRIIQTDNKLYLEIDNQKQVEIITDKSDKKFIKEDRVQKSFADIHSFDANVFNDNTEKPKFLFLHDIKKGFKKFINVKKRVGLVYILLALLGVFMCSNILTVTSELNKLKYKPEYENLYRLNEDVPAEILKRLYDEDKIMSMNTIDYNYSYFEFGNASLNFPNIAQLNRVEIPQQRYAKKSKGFYNIVHGRDSVNDQEIVVSMGYYKKMKEIIPGIPQEDYVGVDMYLQNFKDAFVHETYQIVGICDSTADFVFLSQAQVITMLGIHGSSDIPSSAFYSYTTKYHDVMVLSNDLLMQDFNYSYTDYNQYLKDKAYDAIEINLLSVGSIILIAVIFVFFIMRSRMLQRIYEIGATRAIGASKKNIIKLFIYELIIMITFTSILGVLIYSYFASSQQDSIMGFMGQSYFAEGVIFSVIFIYISQVFVGLLPLILLLRKTPIEILAKYDM